MTVMFGCKASRRETKITWFKRPHGSTSLTSVPKLGKRFTIFPNGSLKISSVQKEDEAFYRCRGQNNVGYTNVSAFLRVLGRFLGIGLQLKIDQTRTIFKESSDDRGATFIPVRDEQLVVHYLAFQITFIAARGLFRNELGIP